MAEQFIFITKALLATLLVLHVIVDFFGYGELGDTHVLDVCVHNRFDGSLPPDDLFFILGKYIHYVSIGSCVTLIALLLFRSDSTISIPLKKNIMKVDTLLGILWFCGGHTLGVVLKHYICDKTCNIHCNTVSGHYNFHIFYMLFFYLLPTYGPLSKEFEKAKYKDSYWILYAVFLFTSVVTLVNTYRGGYHSMRQIIYGCMVAVFTLFVYATLVEAVQGDHKVLRSFSKGKYETMMVLTTSWLVFWVATDLVLLSSLPFSPIELILICGAWSYTNLTIARVYRLSYEKAKAE